MNTLSRVTAIFLVIVSAVASSSAATKPKPKPKPPAKKPAQTKPHYVQGTAQLPGEWGEFGITYTLGKTDPWNITVNSAEYTIEPVLIGDQLCVPKADQKLLVVHFNMHNPQKGEALLRYDTLSMTAVDSKDQNWEYVRDIGAEKTKEHVDLMLKPAQKLDVYTAILVPAAGVVPKLIVKSSDETVIRYDLRGKAKGMSAPFADPNDKTGATALERIPAQMGTYYPLGCCDFKLESASFSDKPIGDQELEEGARNIVFICSAKNRSKEEIVLRYDTFNCTLSDADGAGVDWNQRMYSASRDADLDTNLKPSQEIKFRYACPVPQDVKLKSFAIQEEEGHTFVYDLSGMQ